MSTNDIIVRKEKDDSGLDNFYYVKATKYGDHLDLMACTNLGRKHSKNPTCKKVSKGVYVNTATREIIKAKEYLNRGDNFKLLKKSADNLYKLIHSNFYKNIGYHCVLTYSKPQFDTDELYRDFKIFWQKVRYRYPNMGYISILEPTKKGFWHIHLLLRDMKHHKTFISYYDIRECWTQGICYISKMREKVDYGQYFRKKITADNELLQLYKPGVRYFRHSRNVKKPVTFTATKHEVMNELVDKGDKGEDGRGIADMEIVNGELIVTYTDGTTDNLGVINSGTSSEDTTDDSEKYPYLIFTPISEGTVSVKINSDYVSSIEKVTIPARYNGDTVTTIDEDGFNGCSSLKTISIPNSVTTINTGAFSNCTSLTSLTIPESVTYLGTPIIAGNDLLTEVVFEDTSGWSRYDYKKGVFYSIATTSLADSSKAATLLKQFMSFYRDENYNIVFNYYTYWEKSS